MDKIKYSSIRKLISKMDKLPIIVIIKKMIHIILQDLLSLDSLGLPTLELTESIVFVNDDSCTASKRSEIII